jgi:hypothetical protein
LRQLEFWSRKLYRRAIQFVGSHFYRNPEPELGRSVLVAGTARSGTTWLGDLISSKIPCRILFEPFNPNLVPEYRNFNYFQYMQPETQDQQFYSFARKVFRGEVRNAWIDRQNEQLFPSYRLIKEIRANLALKWLHERFPEVRMVFLMRHPCAVVQSRMELDWATDKDIQPFLSQSELVEDYLSPYLDVINNARTAEEKHAIIWCVNNLVPLRQFKPGELKIVYYENLCTQPDIELQAVFHTLGLEYKSLSARQLNRPSQTTVASSAVVSGTDKIAFWKKKMTATQIDNVLRTVERFGLHTIYNDSLLPLNEMHPTLDS